MKQKGQTSKGKRKTLFTVSLARHKIGMCLRRFVLLGKQSAAEDLLIKRLSIATNMAITSGGGGGGGGVVVVASRTSELTLAFEGEVYVFPVVTPEKNAYAMGKVRMLAFDMETATKVIKSRNSSKTVEFDGFVLWQMNPDMWYVELALGGSKVHAGCNGKLVWRHTPWLGSHVAKGPVRPLRRALQGLDPRTTASMFTKARCIGEKKINGEDCFILKLCADPHTLKSRSEGPAEIIRHVLFGYFCQKKGLLVHLEDSHLTRIQTNGSDAVYWETTINSFLDDYRPVEGIMIAHSGRSMVTLFRFGETAMSHTKTRMEEAWTIEEVAFNVPGLSVDCFIPPAELRYGSMNEACELPQEERVKTAVAAAATTAYRAKVASLGKSDNTHTNNRFYFEDGYVRK